MHSWRRKAIVLNNRKKRRHILGVFIYENTTAYVRVHPLLGRFRWIRYYTGKASACTQHSFGCKWNCLKTTLSFPGRKLELLCFNVTLPAASTPVTKISSESYWNSSEEIKKAATVYQHNLPLFNINLWMVYLWHAPEGAWVIKEVHSVDIFHLLAVGCSPQMPKLKHKLQIKTWGFPLLG